MPWLWVSHAQIPAPGAARQDASVVKGLPVWPFVSAARGDYMAGVADLTMPLPLVFHVAALQHLDRRGETL